MKAFTIQINMAVDFVLAVERYLYNDLVVKDVGDFGYQLDTWVVDWVSNIDTQISPFYKSDLGLLRKLARVEGVLLELIFAERLNSGQELLTVFNQLTGKEFLQLYLKVCRYEWSGEEPLDYAAVEANLRDWMDEKESIAVVLESIHYPNELKERIYQIYKTFYDRFFLPIESEVQAYLEQKVGKHQELLKTEQKSFVETIFLMEAEEFSRSGHLQEIEVYASLFAELSVRLAVYGGRTRALIYGVAMEQRYQSEKQAERQKLFFKVLSDEKRVEILKLLGRRAWYGNELAKHFGLTTATMSYHISKLLDLGLVNVTEGEQNRFYYRLNKERVREMFENLIIEIVGEE